MGLYWMAWNYDTSTSYYPMIVTAIGLILLYFITGLIRKKIRKPARVTA